MELLKLAVGMPCTLSQRPSPHPETPSWWESALNASEGREAWHFLQTSLLKTQDHLQHVQLLPTSYGSWEILHF